MELNNSKIPKDLSECFDILREILANSDEGDWFKNSDEDEVVLSTHHALGEWIRTNWKLWDKTSVLYKYFNKLGLWHPDDISSFILRSFHRLINNKELDLVKQVDQYIEHWKEYEKKYGPTQK